MIEKLKEFHNRMVEAGIPLWFVRDPVKKQPSVSLTMMLISFTFYLFTLVNKFGKWFSDVDGAAQLLLITAGLYFGRSFSGGKGKASLTSNEEK